MVPVARFPSVVALLSHNECALSQVSSHPDYRCYQDITDQESAKLYLTRLEAVKPLCVVFVIHSKKLSKLVRSYCHTGVLSGMLGHDGGGLISQWDSTIKSPLVPKVTSQYPS